jgi:alkylation response protein AidB-like acyl-CoA dehydrogenase
MSSQLAFEGEFAELLEIAHKNGTATEPALRDELSRSYTGLQVMKYNGMRMLTNLVQRGAVGPEASIGKLFWTTWHKSFGETAMRVRGADALTVERAEGRDYELDPQHYIFMASRAETIYAGASEIQKNIIGERVLGLPREPRQEPERLSERKK